MQNNRTTHHVPFIHTVVISDVKRGQNLEAEAEARATRLRPRPKPISRGWGQGRGQK